MTEVWAALGSSVIVRSARASGQHRICVASFACWRPPSGTDRNLVKFQHHLPKAVEEVAGSSARDREGDHTQTPVTNPDVHIAPVCPAGRGFHGEARRRHRGPVAGPCPRPHRWRDLHPGDHQGGDQLFHLPSVKRRKVALAVVVGGNDDAAARHWRHGNKRAQAVRVIDSADQAVGFDAGGLHLSAIAPRGEAPFWHSRAPGCSKPLQFLW